MEYLDNLRQSIRDVSARPQLILPLLIQMLLAMLLSAGMLALGIALVIPEGTTLSEEFFQRIFSEPGTMVVLGAVFLGALLLILLVTAYFQAGLFGMIRSHLKKEVAGWKEFREGTSHYLSYAGFLVITVLLWLLLALPFLAGIGAILGKQLIAGAALMIVGLVLLLILGLFLTMGILFAPPILFFKSTGAIETIKRSFATLRASPVMALVTFGISTALSIAASLFTSLIGMPFRLIAMSAPSIAMTIMLVAVQIIGMAFQLIVALIVLLFLFRNYLSYVEETEITSGKRAARKR